MLDIVIRALVKQAIDYGYSLSSEGYNHEIEGDLDIDMGTADKFLKKFKKNLNKKLNDKN